MDQVQEQKLAWLRRERLRARSGNFLAFYRYACFTRGSTPQRLERLSRDAMHLDMAKSMSSFLRCAKVDPETGDMLGCGKYHLQDPIERDASQNLVSITCPHCGLEDCAGPRRAAEEGFKGRGATEMMMHFAGYLLGYYRSMGYSPTLTLIGANTTEGAERLEWIQKFMETPEFLYTFGAEAVPAEGARGTLHMGADGALVGQSYGWESAPDGHHVSIVVVDDACNQNTSLLHPKDRELLKNKITGTVFQGVEPWTVILYLSNSWVAGDVTSELRSQAKESPGRWKWSRRFMGGPPDFKSPWTKFTSDFLAGEYRSNRRAFERGFMGKEISEEEIAFRDIRYWVSGSDQTYEWSRRLCKGLPTLDGHNLRSLSWPKVFSIDPGFSKSKDKKGRSKTGWVSLTMNPDTGQVFVLYADCRFMPPEDLVKTVRENTAKFGCTFVVPESGGPQNYFVMDLQREGFQVETEARPKGAKDLRKWDIAAAVNEGRVLIRGYPIQGDGKAPGKVECYTGGMQLLETAMRTFPLESDLLDAFENGLRTMWARFGTGAWSGALEADGTPQETRFMRWLHGQSRPVSDETEDGGVTVAVDDGETDGEELAVSVGSDVFLDVGTHYVLQD